jgi:hypothetical protein
MKAIYIQSTQDTPQVTLDIQKGIFEIKGNSYPENSAQFYNPIIEWLQELLASNYKNKIVFDFNFDYFNTSSAKFILEILRILEEFQEKSVETMVRWHYFEDDIDILESGEDYKGIVSIPFELVSRDDTLDM